ncbi:unnamed protein product [Porites lobata]|uniref:Uncharacterized protein n=1 Tax=Porites lobata TaxID=104759 RepID=A0ABN8QPQ2_9CNID|nr:unnamed protein product [Porites lobata]
MKLLDNESSSGLLDLSPDVLQGLQDKHPQAADIAEESLLHGPIDYIPPNVYDLIDEESIYNSASKTKGSAGPSGMDAELYKRILCSKNFKTEGKILREELAVFTRNLLRKSYHPSLLEAFTDHCPLVKQVWLADDSPGGGSIVQVYNWYRQLSKEGQKFGYLVNGTKSWLIVKSRELAEEAKRVFGEEVNITTEGQRHLGASQPHAAYIAFTKGYKSKFTYFMRTIESFEIYVDPIQEVIEDLLLPTLFGQSEPLPNEVRRLATLATGQGGLGIPDLKSEAPQQFAASRLITTAHVDSITSQSSIMVPGERSTEELKRHQQSLKRASAKEKMDSIDSSLSPGLLRLVNQSRDKGARSWLNAMPLGDKGLALNKQEFRDSLRLRYDLPLICNNVEIEPRLQPLDNERFHLRSAVTSSEARLDIKAGGFWARGVTAFFDVRVTHVNSKCYQSKPTSEVFKEQEEEKKRKYQLRVLDVEMGSFTPLVFGTNGGMGNECHRFLKHLADKIAQKDTEPYHVVITWLRTQISFELLRSVHACVRGSRTPFRSKIEQSLDCKINAASADI